MHIIYINLFITFGVKKGYKDLGTLDCLQSPILR